MACLDNVLVSSLYPSYIGFPFLILFHPLSPSSTGNMSKVHSLQMVELEIKASIPPFPEIELLLLCYFEDFSLF